jgi:hypothetical protein
MDEVQNPKNSDCYTPSSEPFGVYDIEMFNFRIILFTSHYMFRSAKIVIGWFTNTYVVTELSIKVDFFFLHLPIIFINKILNFQFGISTVTYSTL